MYAIQNFSISISYIYIYVKILVFFFQIAIGTDDVYKSAKAIKLCGGEVIREPGPLPGINTKITVFLDPDGWKMVCFPATVSNLILGMSKISIDFAPVDVL